MKESGLSRKACAEQTSSYRQPFTIRAQQTGIMLIAALCLSACAMRIPSTPRNSVLWSAGVAHLICIEQGHPIYDGDVQRIVIFNRIVRIDVETGRWIKPRGECKVTRS